MQVYLAGAMEGLTQSQMSEWRFQAARALKRVGVSCLDPCRRAAFHQQHDSNLSRRVVKMDLQDISKCEVILINLLDRGPGKCWGTIAEMAHSHTKNKIIITLIEEGYRHPFVEFYSTEIHHTMEDVIKAIIEYSR